MRKTVFVMLADEKAKMDIEIFFSRVYACAARTCVSLVITMLAAHHLVTIAYAERGYKAFGGEYIAIPVVFVISYKITGFAMKFISGKVVRRWKKEK